MVRKTRAVTLTPEQDKFIVENNINASALLQNEVEKIMERTINPEVLKEYKEQIERMEKNIQLWKDKLAEIYDYIRTNNPDLMTRYLVEKGY
jgi:hypothetical protein